MKPWAQKQQGFTLVELLIVIVVIAILAAISVVAYNGIQQRAVQSKLVTIANTMEKKVQIKRTIDGKASPTGAPVSIQDVRQQYDIPVSYDDVVIQTVDINGVCVESRSDTCEIDRDYLLHEGVASMVIYPTGSTGGGFSGCNSHGGVIIYYGYDEEEDDYKRITVADDPDEGVGQSCWAVA